MPGNTSQPSSYRRFTADSARFLFVFSPPFAPRGNAAPAPAISLCSIRLRGLPFCRRKCGRQIALLPPRGNARSCSGCFALLNTPSRPAFLPAQMRQANRAFAPSGQCALMLRLFRFAQYAFAACLFAGANTAGKSRFCPLGAMRAHALAVSPLRGSIRLRGRACARLFLPHCKKTAPSDRGFARTSAVCSGAIVDLNRSAVRFFRCAHDLRAENGRFAGSKALLRLFLNWIKIAAVVLSLTFAAVV